VGQVTSPAQDLMNWAQIISAVAAAFGLILLSLQLFLQRRYEKNCAIAQLFDEMVTPDFQEKLRLIYSRSPDELVLARLNSDQRALVAEITARFDMLGFKARKGVVPKKETIEIFWDWVIRCAQQLRPHIQDQRRRRGRTDIYRMDFDWLTRECKLYQLKRDGYDGSTKDLTVDQLLQIKKLTIFNVQQPSAELPANKVSHDL
jgi:hypothetical protein